MRIWHQNEIRERQKKSKKIKNHQILHFCIFLFLVINKLSSYPLLAEEDPQMRGLDFCVQHDDHEFRKNFLFGLRKGLELQFCKSLTGAKWQIANSNDSDFMQITFSQPDPKLNDFEIHFNDLTRSTSQQSEVAEFQNIQRHNSITG